MTSLLDSSAPLKLLRHTRNDQVVGRTRTTSPRRLTMPWRSRRPTTGPGRGRMLRSSFPSGCRCGCRPGTAIAAGWCRREDPHIRTRGAHLRKPVELAAYPRGLVALSYDDGHGFAGIEGTARLGHSKSAHCDLDHRRWTNRCASSRAKPSSSVHRLAGRQKRETRCVVAHRRAAHGPG